MQQPDSLPHSYLGMPQIQEVGSSHIERRDSYSPEVKCMFNSTFAVVYLLKNQQLLIKDHMNTAMAPQTGPPKFPQPQRPAVSTTGALKSLLSPPHSLQAPSTLVQIISPTPFPPGLLPLQLSLLTAKTCGQLPRAPCPTVTLKAFLLTHKVPLPLIILCQFQARRHERWFQEQGL